MTLVEAITVPSLKPCVCCCVQPGSEVIGMVEMRLVSGATLDSGKQGVQRSGYLAEEAGDTGVERARLCVAV